MKTRTITLTVALAVLLLLGAAIPTLAQEPGRHQNVVVIAHPRASIANSIQGGAENFMLGDATTVDAPLATPGVKQRLRLQADLEAVFFQSSRGSAQFEMAVFQLEGASRTLIGRARKHAVGVGPRVSAGNLHVDLRFDEPGIYQIAVVATTTTQPVLAPTPVVNEDEMMAIIVVPDVAANGGSSDPVPMPRLAAPVGPPALDFRSSSLEASLASLDDPIPSLDARLVQVASPRGHAIGGTASGVRTTVGVAENFDVGHNKTVIVRQGGTIKFQSGPYELVLFEGANASASTSLEILQVNDDGNLISRGRNEVTLPNETVPHRERGTVNVDVVFDEAGTFDILARIRTAVLTPAADATNAGSVDEDEVRMRVRVRPSSDTGAIAGVVTGEDSTLPLAGVLVRAIDMERGRVAGEGYSDDDGAYVIQGLAAGSYLVRAEPREQNYLPEFYDDVQAKADATPVEVQSGQTTDHIDFALTPGGTISGRITRVSDGAPLGDVIIRVGEFDSNRLVGTTRSLDDGTYAVNHLPAGSYWVYAENPHMDLVPEYYDDAATLDEATPVDVTAGHETTGIDLALVQGGGISGQVIAQSSGPLPVIRPLPGIKVEAADWGSGDVVGHGETDRSGRYRIHGLPTGDYRVFAYDEQSRYMAEYYDDVTNPADATPVHVEPGTDTPEIDFTLMPSGHTLVRIQPPAYSSLLASGPFTVTVVVEAVENLGSFGLEMTYDPEVVHVDVVELGDFLGSTGRTALPLGPDIDNDTGLMEFGGFSTGEEPGPSGSGVLAIVTLSPQGAGSTILHLQNVQLTRPDATVVRTRTQDGQVKIDECIFGDFDCDCDVDNVDVMAVATRWGARDGDPDYDPTYDLDSDGDIDNVDVQLVANAWGTHCDKTVEAYPDHAGGPVGFNVLSDMTKGQDAFAVPLAPRMWLVPASAAPSVGGSLTFQVMIEGAVDVGSFQFEIRFDPVVMEARGATLGSFLASGGGGALPLGPEIDNEDGSLSFGGFVLGQGVGATGSGVLAEVTFSIVGAGQSLVELPHAQTTDSLGQPEENIATQGAEVNAEVGAMTYLPLVVRTSS